MGPPDGEPTAEQEAERKRSARLKTSARRIGVVSDSVRMCAKPLPPSKMLLKSGSKDIVKKGSARKNRYMVVFNGLLAPMAGGKLGTLSQLDSQNPVMYFDFPEGRLKCFGTMVHTKDRYMVLKFGARDSVLCEDTFESMIIFSESHWVGRKEDNPEEKALPFPEVVQKRTIHKEFSFKTGAGSYGDENGGTGTQASMKDSQRTSQSAGKQGRRKYVETDESSSPSSSFGDEEDTSDGDADMEKRTTVSDRPTKKKASAPRRRAARRTLSSGYESSDDEVPLRRSLAKRPRTAEAKRKGSPSSSMDSDLGAIDGHEPVVDLTTPPKRNPGRAAGLAASRKLQEQVQVENEESRSQGEEDSEPEAGGSVGDESSDEPVVQRRKSANGPSQGGEKARGRRGGAGKQQPGRKRGQQKRIVDLLEDSGDKGEDEDDDNDEDEPAEEVVATQSNPAKRNPGRAASTAAKRKLEQIASQREEARASDGDGSESDGESEEEGGGDDDGDDSDYQDEDE
ncbi:unnamed protein product [Ostreobium quekettii]|uniref:DNA-binding protein RHL1 n=1 Tax=Ostreobium quekettii TaxID=121088 RepID=A0A8S1IPE4_9CHLO|nr:unnamed protein product [Ostreobium quekettii]